MAACLLILQYVFFELSYDQQFPKSIYRVGTITYQDGIEFHSSALTPFRVSSQLKGQIPDVKEVVHLYSTSGWFDCTLTYETEGQTKVFNENRGFYFADPAVLSLFQIELVEGDQATALSRPYSLVLSQSTAKKYFGDQSAIGKVLKHRGSFASHDFTVTGVMPDFP